ncbi:FecR family protein [Pedobacter westerhofensis]|uniref:FecR family protein n=1 Tax=Pedobacter westerhofensis TaxID=425512 RepID=A0A521D1M6_9SPHI|nr:FecR domain-containing protein [Pedobacter westerhofensis]SMO64911.1 FecR family protein [Pedobacter westerhofensis]
MIKPNPDLPHYKPEDFITDLSFITWVLLPNPELSAYWEQVRLSHPEQIQNMEIAAKVVSGITLEQRIFDQQDEDQLWSRINAAITKHKKVHVIKLRTIVSAAAAVILVGSLFFFYRLKSTVEFRTAFGEKKTIMLPDHSQVELNANSTLHYLKNWSSSEKREVWITGEALFVVKHLHQSGAVLPADHFVVHAGQLAIEVLGTTFNVNHRRGLVNVALIRGKVSLGLKAKKAVLMKAGEVFEYLSHQDTIIKKKTIAVKKIAWRNNRLEFNQTSVSEVFTQLEDMYGYKVIVQNQEILSKKLTGTFVTSSEAGLLKGLSLALNITFSKNSAKQLIVK